MRTLLLISFLLAAPSLAQFVPGQRYTLSPGVTYAMAGATPVMHQTGSMVIATAQPDEPTLTLPGDVPPVAATGPSRVDRLVDAALSPTGLAALLSLAGAVLGGVAGTSVVRKRRIAKAVAAAYHLVEAVSSETPTPLDDKAAEGLKQLDRYLLAQGWRESTEDEKARAALEFKVMHGEDRRDEKIAVTAAQNTATGL